MQTISRQQLEQQKMDRCRFLTTCAILVLAFSHSSSGQQVATCNNCCKKQNHQEIDNSRRSTQSQWKSGQVALCDRKLTAGWYRFTSFVGGKMPTTKVNKNHCGTKAPIWLDGRTGNHPAGPNDPVVRIKACVNVLERRGGCFFSFYVSVKNCPGNFFLYYLQPTYSCYVAYCAGKRLKICFGSYLQLIYIGVPISRSPDTENFPLFRLRPDSEHCLRCNTVVLPQISENPEYLENPFNSNETRPDRDH